MQHYWTIVDQILFESAVKQVELFELLSQHPERLREGLQYWEMACAGPAIAMVCAAMEAHVNYLYRRASDDEDQEMPNHDGLLRSGWREFERRSPIRKWPTVSHTVAGRDVLFADQWPWREYCEAHNRRSKYIVHPKMVMYPVPELLPDKPLRTPEQDEFTLAKAREAIDAAQAVVRVVYDAMSLRPPRWATSPPYTPLAEFVVP